MYIPSVKTKDPILSAQLLVKLLQLNILLMENIPNRINSYRSYLLSFSTELYQSTNEEIKVWSLYYQCQYIDAVKYNGKQTVFLFLNSLQFYNSKYRDIVYKSTALLSNCMFSSVIVI